MLLQVLNGEIDAADAVRIDSHVIECTACTKFLEDECTRAALKEWETLPTPSGISDGMPSKSLQEFSAHPPVISVDPRGAIRFLGDPNAIGALGSIGPYHILAEIGSGSSSVVYSAFDDRLKREVAIKVLRPEMAAREDERRRFERGAQAAAAIHDPYVVAVFEAGTIPGSELPFVAME
jgi:serine/threonine protein kinase